MKKCKTKIKKLIYKTIPCLCVFVLIISMCLCPVSAIGYTDTVEYYDLSEILSPVTSGDFVYNDVIDSYDLTIPFIQSSAISPGQYVVEGVLNFGDAFSNGKYYSVSLPISYDLSLINVGTCYVSLVDKNGNNISVSRKPQVYPDPFGTTHTYATDFYEFALTSEQISQVIGIKIKITGKNFSSSNSYINFGLINGRCVTVSSISQAEYDMIYGGDYDIDTGDTIARYDDLENQLIDLGALNGLRDFISSHDTINNVSGGILAAGMLFGELYNFGGTRFTPFVMIITFMLTIGLVAFLLNIGSSLFVKGGKEK